MATMKSYTDLEQSKKLAEILPLESADMTYYACVKDWRGNPVEPKWGKPANLTREEIALPCSNFQKYEYVPCWSLAALLNVLPKKYYPVKDHKTDLTLGKPKDKWYVLYWDATGMQDGEQTLEDNLIDACYEMIIKLHEQNLL